MVYIIFRLFGSVEFLEEKLLVKRSRSKNDETLLTCLDGSDIGLV